MESTTRLNPKQQHKLRCFWREIDMLDRICGDLRGVSGLFGALRKWRERLSRKTKKKVERSKGTKNEPHFYVIGLTKRYFL